jgi:hypothetical protein
MAERKPFLLRLDPDTMAALRAWAGDDLRSLNGQIEFLLRRALRDAGRAASNPKHSPGTRRADDIDGGAEADAEPALAALSEGRGNG